MRTGVRQAFVSGASQGFTQLVMFSGYSLAFFVGGQFITSGILTFGQLMRVFLALTMAAQGAGQVRRGAVALLLLSLLQTSPACLARCTGYHVGSQPPQGRAGDALR